MSATPGPPPYPPPEGEGSQSPEGEGSQSPEGGEKAQRLEAVLFDYGHTLIYFDERPHEQLFEAYEQINRLLADRLKRDVPRAQVLIEKVSKAVDDEIQRDYATGREEEVEIAGLYDAALRRLGIELDVEVIEQVMEMEQHGWLGAVHAGPDVVTTLDRLKASGLRLGIVSNAAYLPRLMVAQLEALGLRSYFDGVSFSSEVGVRKPHPAIYRDALRKLAVEPAQALFVGDRLREDVEGPKRLGMRAVLTREWRQEENTGLADFVIERLGELPPIIAGLRFGQPTVDTYN